MTISRLFLLLYLLLVSTYISAQKELTPEQEIFFNKLMNGINTRHVNWVKATAKEANVKNFTEVDIRSRANRHAGTGITDKQDIEALVCIIMMLMAKDANEDLKSMMNKLNALKEQKAKQRELLSKMQQQKTITAVQLDSFQLLSNRTIAFQQGRNPDSIKFVRSARTKTVSKSEHDVMVDKLKKDLDSMSEMGEMESLRLQLLMDKRSKMLSTISNLMKKISKTAEQITQNLK